MEQGSHTKLFAYCTWLFVIAVGLFALASTMPANSSASSRDQGGSSTIAAGRSQRRPLFSALRNLLLQTPASKIAPQVMADTADGETASVVIMLADQADLSAAHDIKDHDARGWFVYNTLTEHAARTQVGLRDFLTSHAIAYESFWAVNMIVATADRQLVEMLAARPDVASIASNAPARGIEDPIVAKSSETSNKPDAPNVAEWGLINVRATDVWALGFTGQGMVIANQDTGMRWTHNAIKPKYRGDGAVPDHNYNWHDSIHSGGGSCGPNTVAPCDDQGHGTHTTGTTVGDDGAGNQIGVAPGAKWIGCRNMDQGNGTPATYTECFQFFMAPTDLTGNNPNPALRPHVMNNSWGCPPSEGCDAAARTTMETVVNNTEAAGIFVVASAGNNGPNCLTVDDPPGLYSASFSVGAYDILNNLASFSSRGPSDFYTPNVLKPNLSAPGSNVRSSTRTSDTSYGNSNGTSMASPHVVGVVALLWSARPTLVRNIAATKALLENTANPTVIVAPQTCGGTASTQIPNNSFGYGRVDALAAFNAAPTASPVDLSGRVTTSDGSPVSGVVIRLSGGETRKTITDEAGNYRFDDVKSYNFYTVTPERVNYHFDPDHQSFTLTGDKTDAVFTATPDAVVTSNPLDTAEYFVRQHYLDFLGREPDESGFNFWSDQILECGDQVGCRERRRINVSAAYFLSIEFQHTGGLVDGLYRASYERRPLYAEFVPEARVVGDGVIVGRDNWAAKLEANKQAFVEAWVQRAEFRAVYDGLTNESYVDTLIAHAAGFNGSRETLVNGLNNSTLTRAAVLRQIVENDGFVRAKTNQMFVMMEYFGYLRRDPDPEGYQFWLNKLNQFGGNFEQAEMVKAFITSGEYRARFPR